MSPVNPTGGILFATVLFWMLTVVFLFVLIHLLVSVMHGFVQIILSCKKARTDSKADGFPLFRPLSTT